MPEFAYTDLLPTGPDTTEYRLLTEEGVRTVEAAGRTFLEVEPEALRLLAAEAMHDISHYLRRDHLAQLRRILDDPEASANDKFVALDLLKNANISAAGVLPMCQDTGTAIVMGKRGQNVLTRGDDEAAISRGVYDAYTKLNLRYSQMAPITMWDETQHRLEPARTGRALRHRRRRLQVPVHGQGRRVGEQVVPLPGDQGGPQREVDARSSSSRRSARSAPRRARRTTSRSSSAAPAPSTRSRPRSTPRRTTSTPCPRRAPPPGTAFATSSSSRRCSS